MEIYKKCGECGLKIVEAYKCDNCSKDLLKECYGVPITVNFGYGHLSDSLEVHFCSNRCATKFLQEEEAKGK